MCGEREVALVASCGPTAVRRGITPRPEDGRYLSHEANVIVYLERVGGLFSASHAYLLKHPWKPHGRALLSVGDKTDVGKTTVPFKKFELEEVSQRLS